MQNSTWKKKSFGTYYCIKVTWKVLMITFSVSILQNTSLKATSMLVTSRPGIQQRALEYRAMSEICMRVCFHEIFITPLGLHCFAWHYLPEGYRSVGAGGLSLHIPYDEREIQRETGWHRVQRARLKTLRHYLTHLPCAVHNLSDIAAHVHETRLKKQRDLNGGGGSWVWKSR